MSVFIALVTRNLEIESPTIRSAVALSCTAIILGVGYWVGFTDSF